MNQPFHRLRIATKPDEALKTADLVVEAVVENIDLKKKIFSEYDKIAPAKTIFASNTSSLPIGDIAVATPDRDPQSSQPRISLSFSITKRGFNSTGCLNWSCTWVWLT